MSLTPGEAKAWESDYFLVDETNAAARSAIFAAFMNGYGKYGIKTVWLDGSEPERSSGACRLCGVFVERIRYCCCILQPNEGARSWDSSRWDFDLQTWKKSCGFC